MGIDTLSVSKELTELSGNLSGEAATFVGGVLEEVRIMDSSDGPENIREDMDTVYKARNFVRLLVSGIELDHDRLIQFADDSLEDVESLGVDPSLIKGLAKSLFDAHSPKAGDKISITGAKRNIEILEEIARLCIENDIDYVVDIMGDDIEAELINNADDEGLAALGAERVNLYKGIGVKLEARSNSSADVDSGNIGKYAQALGPYAERLGSGDLKFSLTILPTPKDAELDGMDFEEYQKLFFESCDQPWQEIKAAQQILIDKFNEGKKIHITNEDGTDLTMTVEGQEFVNSGADVNIPGAEFFTSPNVDSVNGTLVSKGKFKYGGFPVIENITLEFKDGEVIEAHADVGEETLKQILATDEGAKRTGEIAFGGNPHLRRHFINGLLVEKIGGSFHVAVGKSYSFTEYCGQPAKVDNGNRSDIHWDITTMLMGNDGKVYLDDALVHENGIWVNEDGQPDERLKVLSEGWGCLPEDKQPAWWKERYPNGYES